YTGLPTRDPCLLSLHDALPISSPASRGRAKPESENRSVSGGSQRPLTPRSEAVAPHPHCQGPRLPAPAAGRTADGSLSGRYRPDVRVDQGLATHGEPGTTGRFTTWSRRG